MRTRCGPPLGTDPERSSALVSESVQSLAPPLLALAAGILSFTSPCTLPLVPGYLGYMSGVGSRRGRTLAAAAMFVLGFTIVFTALGAGASALGSTILAHKVLLTRVAGILIIALGLFVLGLIRSGWLLGERRPLLGKIRPGPGGAFVLGLAFAAGWTPCIGPMLGAILTLAAARATLSGGVFLLMLYSLGLGIPFLGAALFFERVPGVNRWFGAHGGAINAIGGGLLVGMGILVLTGRLNSLLAPATDLYVRFNWPPI